MPSSFNKKKDIFTNSVVIALKNLEAAAQKFYTSNSNQKSYTFNQGIVDAQFQANLGLVQTELGAFAADDFYTMKAASGNNKLKALTTVTTKEMAALMKDGNKSAAE